MSMSLLDAVRTRAAAAITDHEAYVYHSLTDGEQARLRYALMRELSRDDWDHRSAWRWQAMCRDVQVLKRACALRRVFWQGDNGR
jgi:hypothetical protein